MRRERHRHRLRELHDPALGSRVGELVRDRHDRVRGRHVDDRPLHAALHHLARHEAGEEEGPAQVDAQHPVEVLDLGIQDRARRDDPRVVEEDLAAPEALRAGVEQGGAVALLAHVRAHGERLPPGFLRDASGRVRAALLQYVPQHDIRPVTGEGERARGPDPLRRPADDRGLPLECDHAEPFLIRPWFAGRVRGDGLTDESCRCRLLRG